LNDGCLNITTMSAPFFTHLIDPSVHFRADEKAVQTAHADAVGYRSPDYWELRRIIAVLSPGEQDVVYDLGSGEGRVLSLFARRPVKRCIGVEFGRPLCDIATRKADSLRGRKACIYIVCEAAAAADLNARPCPSHWVYPVRARLHHLLHITHNPLLQLL
jgi:SAM-dependent methyltransferase